MAAIVLVLYIVINIFNTCKCTEIEKDEFKNEDFVFWPEGIVPFYIEPKHFDKEQRLEILAGLTRFASKCCIQFRPVFAEPKETNHVLILENPFGTRKCIIRRDSHVYNGPHRVILGFECLNSPNIDMMIMRTLGFPFEHNRASRDLFIDILTENIEPGSQWLFAREKILPPDLRSLKYDLNSVLHFTDRDYSKNGHRTFIIRNPLSVQMRIDLTATDLNKIKIVYGPECRKRDRQHKIDICKNYPTGSRRKRDVEVPIEKNITNLRINRDIRPLDNATDKVNETIKNLGIQEQIETIIESVHKISETALKSERDKICNSNVTVERSVSFVPTNISDIVDAVSNYVRQLVSETTANVSMFCNAELKLPGRCNTNVFGHWSTKVGAVKHHTQHRPVNPQPTKYMGYDNKAAFGVRFKREVEEPSTATFTVSVSPVTERVEEVNTTTETQINNNRRSHREDDSGEFIISEEFNSSKKEETTDEDKGEQGYEGQEGEKQKEEKQEEDTKQKEKQEDDIKHEENQEDEIKQKEKQEEFEYQKENNNLDKSTKKFVETYEEVEDSAKANKYEPPAETNKKDEIKSNEETGKDEYEENKNQLIQDSKGSNESDEYDENKDEKETTVVTSGMDEKQTDLKENNKKEQIKKPFTLDRPKNESDDRSESEEEEATQSEKNEESEIPMKEKDQKTNFKKEEIETAFSSNSPKKAKTKLPITVPLTHSNKDYYADRIWPQGVVPYILEDNSDYDMKDVRERLNKVNDILKSYTCVELQEIKKSDEEKYQDYVVLDTSPDYVTGRVGGRQVRRT